MKFRARFDTSGTEMEDSSTKELAQRHWHLASVGLGNCRVAQELKREIDRRTAPNSQRPTQAAMANSGTGVSPASPASRLDAAARAIKDLVQRDWHFASVGMGNCRAAQANRRELNEQLLIQSAALANANFNSSEPRDRYGKWTTGEGSAAKTPASPANNPPPTSEGKPPEAVLRPFTPWEKFTSDLRQLKFKLFPGTRPDGQPSPGKVIGAAAMLLPFGAEEATIAKLLPAGVAARLSKVLPLVANTKLSRLLLGYFTAKTASEQPAYYRAIKQELAQGNYSDAIRTGIEDALQLAMVGAGIAGERGMPTPERIRVGAEEAPPKGVDPEHHNANITVRDADGKIIQRTRIVSGNMTPEEKALKFRKDTLASHTEARAVRQVRLQKGESMTITGQKRPCNHCKGAMNRAVAKTGASIKYQWREGGRTRFWRAKPKKQN